MNTHRILAAIALAALIPGLNACASGPRPRPTIPVPDERVFAANLPAVRSDSAASLSLERDRAFQGSDCLARIELDGKTVADARTGERLTLQLDPGRHRVKAFPRGLCDGLVELDLDLKPGEQRSYRYGYGADPSGQLFSLTELTP
ncbi:hypothetical protein [Niveibacterium sp. SC-1]|uniref:hypothetical protein n=1 Tax=Niveibacterium sp. SC-1 TaxID=3135646 RepID=UPI00311F5A8C